MEDYKVLVILNPQQDFIEGGSISIDGGKTALLNLCNHLKNYRYIYNKILIILESHTPDNMSFPGNWEYEIQNPLAPGKDIPMNLIDQGLLRPKDKDNREKIIQELKKQPGFKCWTPNCIKGSDGYEMFFGLKYFLKLYPYTNVQIIETGTSPIYQQSSIFKYLDGSLTEEGENYKEILGKDYTELSFAGLSEDQDIYRTVKDIQDLDQEHLYTCRILKTSTKPRGTYDDNFRLYHSLERRILYSY